MYLALSLIIIVVIFLLLLILYHVTTKPLMEYSEKLPGPKPIPLLGNLLSIGFDPNNFFNSMEQLASEHGRIMRLWFAHKLVFVFLEPEYIQALLSSQELTDKAYFYKFMKETMGEGMITSSGQHWKNHRKLITPAFHFKILEQFVEVFESNSKILINKWFDTRVDQPDFDVYQDIELCAFDNICETALGNPINAQSNNNSEYVHAVKSLINILFQRITRPWIHPHLTFALSPQGRDHRKAVSIVRNMTDSVIKTRRQEFLKENTSINENTSGEFGIKRRLAFLDLLIQSSANGAVLTDKEIRDEVHTFTYAGYETVSSAMSFCLWCLSQHPSVQEKVSEEIKQIFGESERDATYQDLQDMKYLEMVIKESMRLYPSVFVLGRHLTKTVKLGDYVLPAGTDVFVAPYIVHRHPDYFPDPERFDPERFSPENSVGRHPYCYIPFSAGPRNCIGQKFAICEMKSTISRVIRNFEIIESDTKEVFKFIGSITLNPVNGIMLKLKRRKKY